MVTTRTKQKNIFVKNTSGERGFTLVEVLVALSIFSVAVTGVISVAAQGGLTANIVKFKVEATYLADEGLELARALRDSTVIDPATPAYTMWKSTFVGGTAPVIDNCLPANPCDIDVRNADPSFPYTAFPTATNIVHCGVGTPCQLYYDDVIGDEYRGYYLDHPTTSTGVAIPASPFSRSITFEPILYSSYGGYLYPTEVKVTSTVTWHEGSNVKTFSQTENLFGWYM